MFFNILNTNFTFKGVHHMHWPKRRLIETGNGNDFHSISYAISAKSVFTFDDKKLYANSQSITFIPDNIKFERNALMDYEIIVIHFLMSNPPTKNEITVLNPQNPVLFERLFNEIYQIYRAKSFGFSLKCSEYLYRIIYMLLNEEMQQENYENLSIAERAAQTIEKELANPYFSVDSIAKMFNISKTYLRTLFNNFYGISPKEYQIKARMQFAETLIRSNCYSVKQIASQCGYEDAKYFSTSFKKYFGTSPKYF